MEDLTLFATLTALTDFAGVDDFPDFITEDVALVRTPGGLTVADLLLLF